MGTKTQTVGVRMTLHLDSLRSFSLTGILPAIHGSIATALTSHRLAVVSLLLFSDVPGAHGGCLATVVLCAWCVCRLMLRIAIRCYYHFHAVCMNPVMTVDLPA